MTEPYRAGYVAVVGRPNVGKSTLVNALVGVKISIVSAKPQTTRHRMLGIASSDAGQLVLVDTPGIHREQGNAMSRHLNRAARGALPDVNAALLVIEAGRWHAEDSLAYEALVRSGVPCVLAINKIDRIKDKTTLLPFIAEHTHGRDFAAVHPISALQAKGLDALRATLLRLMPESAPVFDEDEITDKSQRFLAAELAALPMVAPRALVMRVLRGMFADPGRLRDAWYDAAVDEFGRVFSTPRGRMAFFSAARQIYLEEAHGEGGFWERLPALAPPALFLWGERDQLVPCAFARHVTAALPGVRSIVLADCGHVPQFELPEETHRLTREFLRR